jgi:hypothetical protein
MQFRKILISTAVAVSLAGIHAQAAVSPQEAARLGKDLTMVGAEKAGNGGAIPAFDGGLTRPPAGINYKVGDFHPDPFAADKPSMTIDGSNYKQHLDKLPAGAVATFERYPQTFKMPIFPTRRSATFPEYILEYTVKNATTGKIVGEGAGVSDVAIGIPFPILSKDPKMAAYEAIWNHKMKYKGIALRRWNNQVAPTVDGKFTPIKLEEELLGLYWRKGSTIADTGNVLQYLYQVVVAPARLAGNGLLVHETIDQLKLPRQAWIYNPGQRRVRKAPNVAYDNPGTASDGLRTNDMTDMFNGALDRYEWKYVGKKEMYVPYNAYKLHRKGLTYDEIVRPGHMNTDLLRYELHRVHVVEATLRAGQRHINPRRTFYLDEDSWQIVAMDHYDAAGKLWRYSEAHCINYYEQPVFWATIESHYDLKSGRYLVGGIDNMDTVIDFSIQTTPDNFSPQALRTRGTR